MTSPINRARRALAREIPPVAPRIIPQDYCRFRHKPTDFERTGNARTKERSRPWTESADDPLAHQPPRRRARGDHIEVSGIRHDHQLGRTARRLHLVDVRPRIGRRGDRIVGAGDHDDPGAVRQHLRRGGVGIGVGPCGARRTDQGRENGWPAHRRDTGRLLEIAHSAETDHAADGERIGNVERTAARQSAATRRPQRQVRAGRVTDGDDAGGVQPVLLRVGGQQVGRLRDILEDAGIGAAGFVDTPIADTPHRDPTVRELAAQARGPDRARRSPWIQQPPWMRITTGCGPLVFGR